MFQFGSGPRDDAQQRFHHAARYQRFTTGFIAGQVVQEREEGRGQGQREWRHLLFSALLAGQRSDAAPHQNRQKAVVQGRSSHIDDRVQLDKVGIAVQVDDGRQRSKGRSSNFHQLRFGQFQNVHQFFQQTCIVQLNLNPPDS